MSDMWVYALAPDQHHAAARRVTLTEREYANVFDQDVLVCSDCAAGLADIGATPVRWSDEHWPPDGGARCWVCLGMLDEEIYSVNDRFIGPRAL